MIKNLLKTIVVFILVFMATSQITRVTAEAPQPIVEEAIATLHKSEYSQEDIINLIKLYSEKYQVDKNVLIKMAECESNFKQNTYGDKNNAFGLYQFWNETWHRHSIKYFGHELDKNSVVDQIMLASAAISGGDGNEWTSYRAIKNGGSYTFYYKLEKRYVTVYCKI